MKNIENTENKMKNIEKEEHRENQNQSEKACEKQMKRESRAQFLLRIQLKENLEQSKSIKNPNDSESRTKRI